MKGGLNSLPKLTFPGGCLIGDDAGFLNFAKIKGSHTAMKSGMLCGEAVFEAIARGVEKGGDLAVARVVEGDDLFDKELTAYTHKFDNSWLKEELHRTRNFGPAMHKFGLWMGGAFNFVDQNIFQVPFTLHDLQPDYSALKHKTKSVLSQRIQNLMARLLLIVCLLCLFQIPCMKKISHRI